MAKKSDGVGKKVGKKVGKEVVSSLGRMMRGTHRCSTRGCDREGEWQVGGLWFCLPCKKEYMRSVK